MMAAMPRVLFLLSLVLSLGVLGCAKDSSANYSSYPGAPADDSYGDYGGYGGTGGGDGAYAEGSVDYDYSADMATEAPAPPAEPARWAGRNRAEFKAEKERRGRDDFESAPEPEEAVMDPKPAETPGTEPLEVTKDVPKQPAPVSQKRQVIYTATMQVSVYDLEHSLEIVESLPERYGGWMQQRIDNQVVLRIPAERLSEAMATVAELGVVDYRLLEALDVTAEYTDLESRIRILAEMQKQLAALLAKATSVEQALEIRRALDQVTLELEAARAQMRELSKSIAFSTLILSLVERGPTQLVPSSNDPFPWVDELGVEVTDYR
jgi:chemotaxis protein histidine kinase CheA